MALAVLAAWAWSDGTLAQSPRGCIKASLSGEHPQFEDDMSPAMVNELIIEIRRSIGIHSKVEAVSCTWFTGKASAWRAHSDPEIPNGQYMVYNPEWVRETIGADRIQAIALFGHELGHFLNGHLGDREHIPLLEREREADHFAGCAVARLAGQFARIEDLLSRIRKTKDEIYPNRLQSREDARAGFIACGGQDLHAVNPLVQVNPGPLPVEAEVETKVENRAAGCNEISEQRVVNGVARWMKRCLE